MKEESSRVSNVLGENRVRISGICRRVCPNLVGVKSLIRWSIARVKGLAMDRGNNCAEQCRRQKSMFHVGVVGWDTLLPIYVEKRPFFSSSLYMWDGHLVSSACEST